MYLLVYLHLHISVFDKVFCFQYNDCCVTQSSKSDCPKVLSAREEEEGGQGSVVAVKVGTRASNEHSRILREVLQLLRRPLIVPSPG